MCSSRLDFFVIQKGLLREPKANPMSLLSSIIEMARDAVMVSLCGED